MPDPKGSLTAAQYEIMTAIWQAGEAGISVADIWQAIGQSRSIGRTTVLNQVDRLEKRGWLKRVPGDGATRFRATLSKDDASQQLVASRQSELRAAHAGHKVTAANATSFLHRSQNRVKRSKSALDQLPTHDGSNDHAIASEQLLDERGLPFGRSWALLTAVMHQRPAPFGTRQSRGAARTEPPSIARTPFHPLAA